VLSRRGFIKQFLGGGEPEKSAVENGERPADPSLI
jgi:hypothetical protein